MSAVVKLLSTPAVRAAIVAVLSLPPIREFMHDLVLRIVAEIFHRRKTDPEYEALSDAAFQRFNDAKTEKEEADAIAGLRALVSGDSL